MTVPTTKERGKCLNTEKPSEEAKETDKMEEITEKKVAKLLFGIFIFFCLFKTTLDMGLSCAAVIDWTSPQTRSIIAAVFLALVISIFLFYCCFREACHAVWRPFWDETFAIFSPRLSWNKDGPRVVGKFTLMFQFLFLSEIFRWSWMTLLFGPETSSIFYKSNDKIEGLAEQTYWNETKKVNTDFRYECFAKGQLLLIVFITLAINIWCMLHESAREHSMNKKPANIARLWRIGYGESEFGLAYLSFYFSMIFLDNAVTLIVLSGWVNAEFVESLNWFSSLFLVAIPSYIVYFLLSCIMELFIYAIECFRKEEKQHLPLPEESPSVV